MTRALLPALVAAVLVPASAGAGTARPTVALTATPAHVSLAASGSATIRVSNTGREAVGVEVARAGFSLDLRGRPRIARRPGGATAWLVVRPSRLVVPPGATAAVVVSSRLPPRAEPGDHDALVLLTTQARRGSGLAVRMRLGVVVVVRAPGRVVRRLAPVGLRVARVRGVPVLRVRVVNRGNVTETLARGRVRIVLRRRSVTARLLAPPQTVRPRTAGIVQLAYRGRLAGWLTARVEVADESGEVLRKSFRLRL